jgi:hypothetical protein
MGDRARRYEAGVRRRLGIPAIAREYAERHGTVVSGGPFAGLTYPLRLLESVDAPVAKLTGTYEQELHPFFGSLRPPGVFIDIGAADGYYAVGMRRPGFEVWAFELAPSARRMCRQVAAENAVDVRLGGRVTTRQLKSLRVGGAVVLCDIEGAEYDVLDNATVEALDSTTVVVELHEHLSPGVTEVLRQRFKNHACEIIKTQPRTPPDGLPALAVDEMRPPMAWAIFRPRNG